VRRRARELLPQPLGPVTPRFSLGSSWVGRREGGREGGRENEIRISKF